MGTQIDYYSYYCHAYATVRSGANFEKISVSSDPLVSCSYALGADDAQNHSLKNKSDFMLELSNFTK